MKNAVCSIVIALAFVAITLIRFTHQGMTETQLFISFWPVWLLVVATLLTICCWLYKR